jgi:DNA repair exonuclease SbcCD ATPase subunit
MFGGGKQNPEHVKAELLNIELKLSQTESKIASLQERQRRAVELMGQLGPLGTQLAQKGAALQNMVSRGGNVRQLNAEIGDIQSQMNALRMRMSAHLGDFKTVEGIADHLKTMMSSNVS